MSSVMTTPPSSPVPPGGTTIPGWVTDLDSFRRWAWSDEFPERGQFSFLGSDIWVDLTMEELWTHNQVKAAYAFALMSILKVKQTGRFVVDRMLLTNVMAALSTEPDGLFFFWSTVLQGRLREVVRRQDAGVMELEGTPDMVLEIVSKTSVHKDTILLRELYWKAGIPEYWLVDVRNQKEQFEILRHEPQGYVAEEAVDGWLTSRVFGHHFKLAKSLNPLGRPEMEVLYRES